MDDEVNEPPCLLHPWALLEGGTAILAGEAGIGKSFFALELCRAFASASPPFRSPVLEVRSPLNVLYLEQELTEAGLRKRIRAMFRNSKEAASRVWYVSTGSTIRIDSMSALKDLETLVSSLKPDVIVFDPIGRFHLLPEDDATSVGRIFEAVDRVKRAASPRTAAIVVHHVRKPPADPESDYDPLSPYNIRGSSRWYDIPETRIMIAREGDGFLRARWRMRHAPTISQRIRIRITDDEVELVEVQAPRPAAFTITLREDNR